MGTRATKQKHIWLPKFAVRIPSIHRAYLCTAHHNHNLLYIRINQSKYKTVIYMRRLFRERAQCYIYFSCDSVFDAARHAKRARLNDRQSIATHMQFEFVHIEASYASSKPSADLHKVSVHRWKRIIFGYINFDYIAIVSIVCNHNNVS